MNADGDCSTPIHDLAEEIEALVQQKYPGLAIQDICAAMEMVRVWLLLAAMEEGSETE